MKILKLSTVLLLFLIMSNSTVITGGLSNRDNPSTEIRTELRKLMEKVQNLPMSAISSGVPLKGANLIFANPHNHEKFGKPVYLGQTLKYLRSLHLLGTRVIHVDVGYPVTRSETALRFYTEVISEAKKLGMLVHVEYEVIGGEIVSLEELEEVLIDDSILLVNRLKPDMYTIIAEPTTTNSRLGLNLSPDAWSYIVNSVASSLKNLYPDVKIGAGGLPKEMSYIVKFIDIEELDYIDLHWYNITERNLDTLLKISDLARYKGKEVLLGETWCHYPYSTPPKNRYTDILQMWEPVDAEFLELVYYLASAKGFISYEMFFTNYFFTYLDREVLKEVSGEKELLDEVLSRTYSAVSHSKLTASGKLFKILPSPETCSNFKDDDGDGLSDSDDPDCWLREPIFEMGHGYEKVLTFKEQEEMLPVLKEMGIKVIYLTPIWDFKPGTSLRRYYILDYYKLDPRKCERDCSEELRSFVYTAHRLGMKVLLDLVTAHTGPGRYIYENHPDWILRDIYGKPVLCWPHLEWGYAVDRAKLEVIEHFTQIAKYYVQSYGIDGWRIDAPATHYCTEEIPNCTQPVEGEHTSLKLLESLRESLPPSKGIYLENYSLGRIYYTVHLVGKNFHVRVPSCWEVKPYLERYGEASYSYAFREYIIPRLFKGELSSEGFVKFFKLEPNPYFRSRSRFLVTHDLDSKVFSSHPNLHKLGVVLICTVPGTPHIFHTEIFPTGKLTPIDKEIYGLYKKLLKLREGHPALKFGNIENVLLRGDKAIAYQRIWHDDVITVLINFSSKDNTIEVDLRALGSKCALDVLSGSKICSDNTVARITLKPLKAVVLIPVSHLP